MSIELQWVELPDGVKFRTICRDGLPLCDVTSFLLQYVQPEDGSRRTVDTYGSLLLPLVRWADQQGLQISALTPQHFKAFARDISAIRETRLSLFARAGHHSARTLEAARLVAAQFLSWRAGDRGGKSAFLTRVTKVHPRLKGREGQVLTQSALDACRRWIDATYAHDSAMCLRNHVIVELLWDGALRLGSMLSLQVKNIDWVRSRILVSFEPDDYRRAWYGKLANERSCKTREYVVTVAPRTLELMRRYWLEARPQEAIRQNHGLLLCLHATEGGRCGAPLTTGAVRHLFDMMSRPAADGRAGVRVTPHMLRRTWAVMALNDGLALEVIRIHLGHKSILTTQRYTERAVESLRTKLEAFRRSHPDRYLGVDR